MDRVTKSYLKNFSDKFDFDDINESLLFEHFVNYSIIEPKSEYPFEIEDVNIGINGTIGIDGFALLLNRELITDIDNINYYLDTYKKCSAEVVLIQTKTSQKFDSSEIGNFGHAVQDFIAEKQNLNWSNEGIEKIKLFNDFIDRISELKENPSCSLYYVTLGKNNNDKNIEAVKANIEKNIFTENIFSKISFDTYGAIEIQNKYKKIGETIEKSFIFSNRVTLPIIENVKEAYIGIVDTKSIIELMTDEKGNLLKNIFYDNVRDYQGGNKVNSEISDTLNSNYKDSFSIMNNGITIVAESLTPSRDTFTITNYQIINGCQTSHVLFENKETLDESVKVSIKLIITDDEDVTSRIIRSTNRQTEVKEQDLLAFSNFQKRLEDYFKTFGSSEQLFYERRSKQYNSSSIDKKRIIDKTTLIKAMASMFYDKPNMATRFFGALFKEFGNKLFEDDHEMLPYFVASFAIYKIETLFRLKKLDKKYKKIKYHILMMIRHEIDNSKCPSFKSKKSIKYCQVLFDILKDDDKLLNTVNESIKKISSLPYDIDSSDISKSKEFVTDCLKQYNT
jgi:hypothetical protein